MATTEGPKKPKKPLKKAEKPPRRHRAKLNPREEKFCQIYSTCLIGSQAVRLAGYSPHAANVTAAKLLARTSIQARVMQLRKNISDKYNITRESIIQEYGKLVHFNTKSLFKSDGSLIPIHELPDEVAAAISGLEVSDDEVTLTKLHKIKTYDKVRALEGLKKMLGFDAPEKVEVTGKDGEALIPPTINVLPRKTNE